MTTMPNKPGRPAQPVEPAPPEKRERYSIGTIVTAEMKQLIDETAKATGRTQGQVIEALCEKALQYDRMISAMNKSLEQIRQGNTEAAFRAEGYVPVLSPHGKIWLPRDYPIERSRFIAQQVAAQEEEEK
jgi:predicted DNA-binding protein